MIRVLEWELNALEDRKLVDDHANALHQVLLLLIDGLEKLDKGEVSPIFARSKVKARGKRPATLWEGRLTAIVAVRALRLTSWRTRTVCQPTPYANGEKLWGKIPTRKRKCLKRKCVFRSSL
jgi:hypothetical protein